MAEFAPPSGPPPPKVPEGWKAVWNEQYSEWFYVNIYTKKSQWDKPTEPVYPPGEAPDGPPPSYAPSTASGATDGLKPTSEEKSRFSSNNPYASPTPTGGSNATMSEDERLARQLQDEEQARANSSRGAADSFYNQGPSPGPQGQYGYGQQSPFPQAPSPYSAPVAQERGGKKGLLGKLLGKTGSSSHQPQYGYPQQQGYPPQQYGGGYGQPGYGQPGPQGYYGGQPGYYPQQPQMMHGRPGGRGGGMGVGSAAALGVGGGLLGGALLGSAMADDGGDTYIQNNYDDNDGDFGDFD